LTVEQDVADARAAIDDLGRACSSAARHLPDTASFYDDGYDRLMDAPGRGVL
jgi:hypothetical protein